MKIVISKKTSVSEIQKKFSEHYPSLKLEFYKHKAVDGMNTEGVMGDDNHFKKEAAISIHKEQTVAEFEKDFWEKTGVAAQVFRHSGNIWLQTTRTDDWTLEQQNAHGAE